MMLLMAISNASHSRCEFTATLKILEGALLQMSNPDAAGDLFHTAIWFILGACFFDLLDGRLARLGGHESAFGREFDSLADIVSFGVAPALIVYRVVLQEFPRACWIIAFIYLTCGALRLARFNTVAGGRILAVAAGAALRGADLPDAPPGAEPARPRGAGAPGRARWRPVAPIPARAASAS